MAYIYPSYRSFRWFVVVPAGVVLTVLTGCGPSPRAAGGYHPTLEKELAALRVSSRNMSYVVNAGDTLWSISRRFGTTIGSIIDANGIDRAAALEVGQILKIPAGGSRAGRNTAAGSQRGWVWPVRGDVITAFGRTKGRLKSFGIDIRTQAKAKIVAAGNGTVRKAGPFLGLGKTIVIQHDKEGKVITLCSGLGELAVSAGEQVRKGQVIGIASSIGGGVSIVHFRMFRRGAPVDPRKYLP